MKNFPIIAVDERVELKEQTNARVPEKKTALPDLSSNYNYR